MWGGLRNDLEIILSLHLGSTRNLLQCAELLKNFLSFQSGSATILFLGVKPLIDF